MIRLRGLRSLAAALTLAVPVAAPAQTPAEDYQQSCAMCHTIGGGPLAGPDLAGMSERRERSWLIRFIVDPQAVIDSGDSAAQAMVDEYKGMVMPALPGMTHERAAALVDYVRAESAPPGEGESASATHAPSPAEKAPPEPFTQQDIERGRELYLGVRSLEAGGAACLSCHDVKGLDSFGGGSLGPNLTEVYERFGGRQGLESWLSAPPTPLMSELYRTKPLSESEIAGLTAFFEERAADDSRGSGTWHGAFFLLGALGTGLLLGLFQLLWRNRLTGVRRKLVHNYRMRGAR